MLFECIQVAALRQASILIVSSALLLLLVVVYEYCCCCCCKARRLCELHLTDGSRDLLHHLQRRAGLELKNGTRYSFVSHSKKSLSDCRKFERSNRAQKQTQRNEIKRGGGETEIEICICA